MSNIFRVQGEGPVWEFLQHRPESVVEVRCALKYIEAFEAKIAASSIQAPKLFADNGVKDVQARVKIDTVDISGCYQGWAEAD